MIKLYDLINEEKQVGILYHYTIYEAVIDILTTNKLESNPASDFTNVNGLEAISFTRDKNFHKKTRTIGKYWIETQCRIRVDGNSLSNKYKFGPFAQHGFEKGKDRYEAEERIYNNKHFTIPIKKYILSIDVVIDFKHYTNWIGDERYKDQIAVLKLCKKNNIPFDIIDKSGSSIPMKKTILQKIFGF